MSTNTHSRRAFLARSGGAVAATSVLGGLLASQARAAAPTAGLPTAASVLATDEPLIQRDVLELAALLQAGEVTSVEVTRAHLDRYATFNGPQNSYADNGSINAFIRVDPAAALADAAAADVLLDAARAGGALAPLLCGIPFGFEDVIAISGVAVQNGTAAFAGNVGVQDADVVARLRSQGAVVLGLTTCTPFSSLRTPDGASPAAQYARNPWDTTKDVAGTAGGSAIAPIAGMAAATLAVDTDGGMMLSASVSGTSAILASVGLVPTAGIMPDVPGADAVGALSRSLAGASLALNAMVGPDVLRDPVSGDVPADYPLIPIVPRTTKRPLKGVTIGLPKADAMQVGTDVRTGESPSASYAAGHKAALDRFVSELQDLGAEVKEFPGLDLTDATKNPYLGSTATAATSGGATLTAEGVVEASVRSEVRYTVAVQAFAAGVPAAQATALTEYYGRATTAGGTKTLATAVAIENGVTWGARVDAEAARRTFAANYRQALADAGVDFMLVLTHGATVGARGDEVPVRRAALGAANALGWPMVNLPIGESDGLPVSAAFWGPRLSEPEIVQAGIDYQSHHPEWHTKAPTAFVDKG